MKKLLFMTGTNCCGKSSIVKHMIATSPEKDVIEYPEYKTVATVLKEHNLIVLGKYSEKTTSGGCDTIHKKAYMQDILKQLWGREEDIIMEGYLIGTRVWIDDLLLINKENDRKIIFVHPDTKLETCFERISKRSGKLRHELRNNGANVVDKYDGVKKFKEWLKTERPQVEVFDLECEGATIEEICNRLPR